MKFKIIPLLMAIFALGQLGHSDKAHATPSGFDVKSGTKSETTVHGGGCCCGGCGKIESSTPVDLIDWNHT